MPTYTELRLRIDRVSGRSYRVHATGPAGEADGAFKLPFSDLELENVMLRMGGRGRGGTRGADSPEMELAKSFGSKLFAALFQDEVRDLYHSCMTEARNADQGLRVTMSLTDAPKLLQVPWEYLYDKPSFLAISTWTPVVRYLDLPKPRRPLTLTLPLRILGLVSAPTDREKLDVEKERTNLQKALEPLAPAVVIDWLEEPSLRALTNQLRREEYHVFHYIGHGEYDRHVDAGFLLFEDDNHLARRVSGDQLGMILRDEVSLRLAVLNACESAQSSPKDPFSSVGSRLIEHEIPAVVAMQFGITDRAAIVFAGGLYGALAEGLPIDSSIAEARKAIYADHNDIEWGTPVLFMRVADGRLFDVQPKDTVDLRSALDSGPSTAERKVQPEADVPLQTTASLQPVDAQWRQADGASWVVQPPVESPTLSLEVELPADPQEKVGQPHQLESDASVSAGSPFAAQARAESLSSSREASPDPRAPSSESSDSEREKVVAVLSSVGIATVAFIAVYFAQALMFGGVTVALQIILWPALTVLGIRTFRRRRASRRMPEN